MNGSLDLSEREKTLLDSIKNLGESAAHSVDHLLRVVQHELHLLETVDANRDICVAAALCHDLSRHYGESGHAHGKASAQHARSLLEADYTLEEIEAICTAVTMHHAPPEDSPLEAKVLFDADKLDGFGPIGIARVYMHYGERGQSLQKALHKAFEKDMITRITGVKFDGDKVKEVVRGVFFDNTKKKAIQLYGAVQDHLDQINAQFNGTSLQRLDRRAKIVVVDGMSGAGKGTYLELIKQDLEKEYEVIEIKEPSPYIKKKITNYSEAIRPNDDPWVKAFFFGKDRRHILNTRVYPFWDDPDKVFLFDRSFLATLVYQSLPTETGLSVPLQDLMDVNAFFPEPDIAMVFVCEPETALQRICERKQKTGKQLGRYENREWLPRLKEGFSDIAQRLPYCHVVNTEGTEDDISRIYEQVKRHLYSSILK